MPEALKELINQLSSPELFITLSVVLFVICLIFYRWVTRPWPAGIVLAVSILFLVLSFEDEDFWKIISKPDNVPIAMMLVIVEFFTWLSMKQAAKNDEFTRAGEREKIYEDMIR